MEHSNIKLSPEIKIAQGSSLSMPLFSFLFITAHRHTPQNAKGFETKCDAREKIPCKTCQEMPGGLEAFGHAVAVVWVWRLELFLLQAKNFKNNVYLCLREYFVRATRRYLRTCYDERFNVCLCTCIAKVFYHNCICFIIMVT